MNRRSFLKLAALAGGIAALPPAVAQAVLDLPSDDWPVVLPKAAGKCYLLGVTICASGNGLARLQDGEGRNVLSVWTFAGLSLHRDTVGLGVPEVSGDLELRSETPAIAVLHLAKDTGRGFASMDDLIAATSSVERLVLVSEGAA